MRTTCAGLAALFALCASAQAATYTVSGTGDELSGSCSVAHVCTSLRAAVQNVPPGSTISLGGTQYTLSLRDLTIGQSVSIVGTGAAHTSIKQTQYGYGVITATSGSLALSGLTVTGAHNTGADPTSLAGGIYDSGTALALHDVTVSGNVSDPGQADPGTNGTDAIGGIEVEGASLIMDASAVVGNVATGGDGGNGISGRPGGEAFGGIEFDGPTLSISRSTISLNKATGGTGGIASGSSSGFAGGISGQAVGALNTILGSGSGTVSNTTISSNQTIGGRGGGGIGGASGGPGNTSWGAVTAVSGTLNIRSSLIAGNTNVGSSGGNAGGTVSGHGGNAGGAEGGGVSVGDEPVNVVNSTIANNVASAGTGGTGHDYNGGSGYSNGGGVQLIGSGPLALVNDTLAGNHAEQGGNLDVNGNSPLIQATIITGGVALVDPNCDFEGNPPGAGTNNLESTAPSQCGFSAAKHDLTGVNPLLAPLAANGGPTRTEALGARSPARGAGGTCHDPTQTGDPLLSTDQRGLPRPAPCDIGAFQGQSPKNAAPPQITGKYGFAHSLTCAPGTWTGDGVTRTTFQWLRGTKPIRGATHEQYKVTSKDFGIVLSCRVSAIGTYGTASATASRTAPKHCNCVPRLTHVSQARRSWTRSQGTVFRFTLDRAARVRLRFRGKHGGTLTIRGHRGQNKFTFRGRISAHSRLAPGRYTLAITARLAVKGAPASKPAKLTFTIL